MVAGVFTSYNNIEIYRSKLYSSLPITARRGVVAASNTAASSRPTYKEENVQIFNNIVMTQF
jgi:hypothetical protein